MFTEPEAVCGQVATFSMIFLLYTSVLFVTLHSIKLHRLKSMESTKNKRLHALQRSGADKIFEAYDWVQEHRHEFKREVYGPVLIEV